MSVGVPGTLVAWQKALDEYGTWSLGRALQPGIAAAQHGFAVDQTFFNQTDEAKAIFADFPATAALYLDPDGSPRDVGTRHQEPRPRAHLRADRPQGPRRALLGAAGAGDRRHRQAPAAAPGLDAVGAPRRHGAQRPRRLQGDRPRPDAHRLPRPRRLRHGAAVLAVARRSARSSTSSRAIRTSAPLPREQALHYYLEASRLAYADRGAFVADPGFVSVPLAQLLSDQFAAQRRAKIAETAATRRSRRVTRAPSPTPARRPRAWARRRT